MRLGATAFRVRLAVVALSLALLASGCAVMRIAYDNADTYARWRAGNYLDLEGEQAHELEARIDAFHAWHRAHALPQYETLAREAARRLEDGLSPQDVVWGYDSLLVQAREGLREAAERIAPLLDRLDARQLAHIERGFAEDNRRFAREHLRGSERERQERRVERIMERLENWVGTLSEPQIERVRQFAARAPAIAELRDADRRRIQGAFLDLVRNRRAEEGLPGLAAHWERDRSPAYEAAFQASRHEFNAMLLDLDRMLTPGQRARAVDRFRRYADDFRALSAPGARRRAS